MSDAIEIAMDLSNAIKNKTSFVINPENILVLTEELLRLDEENKKQRESFRAERGIACLEHDLVHFIACGRCYECLSEAVKEAREIFEDMSPHLKMSETIGTLTRRTEIQGNKALAWLEKYGSEK